MRRGNCYVATEALWHILGGRHSGWKVMRMKVSTERGPDTHWFLWRGGLILDPSRRQFKYLPQYQLARRSAFLTRRPSQRARALMRVLTWQ